MTRIHKMLRPQMLSNKRGQLSTKAVNHISTKYKKKTKIKSVLKWLQQNHYENHGVDIQSIEIKGRTIDKTVASKHFNKDDLAFRIPRNLIVTLDRVFEGDTLAELLTTDKLSELACLTLYMMYEKKKGKESFWYPFIKELDKLRGRGPQGAESPILWPAGEADSLLAGSPVLSELKTRINEINKNYNECDTVWYLAGSLFNQYPYDIPTECFSLELFKSAFVAIQACIVHLQNVPLSRRFALVPLGPPLLSYSSSSEAILKFNPDTESVDFAVDKEYEVGEPLYCWCGPQINRRLLINYGIVDDDNPHDSLDVTVTIPTSDPLFRMKRNLLLGHGMTSQERFQLQRGQPLPSKLFSCLRIACTDSESKLKMIDFLNGNMTTIDLNLERTCLSLLYEFFQDKLKKYRTSISEDEEIIRDPETTPRQKVSARLLKIEKEILQNGLSEIHTKFKSNFEEL